VSQTENLEKDKWDLALDDNILKLKECQNKMQVASCLDCDKCFECDIRENYVKSVYESMSKGSGGGFEF